MGTLVVVTGDGVVVGSGVVVGVPLTVVGLGQVVGASVYTVDGTDVGACVVVVFVTHTLADVFGAAGVVVVIPALLVEAAADGEDDGDAEADVESDGSATLATLPLAEADEAGELMVDTAAADDFAGEPLEIM